MQGIPYYPNWSAAKGIGLYSGFSGMDPGAVAYGTPNPVRVDMKFVVNADENEIQGLLQGSVAPKEHGVLFNCGSGDAVGNPAYFVSSDTVASANSLTQAGANVIGFITAKPTPTTCYIHNFFNVTNLTGGVAGQSVYLKDDGTLGATPGTVSKIVGQYYDVASARLFAVPIPALSGFSGYSGASGSSGTSGSSGASGTSGFSGTFSGKSGYSGASGLSGFSGAFSGISGYSGVITGVATFNTVKKSADTVRTSTSNSDDPDLHFTLAANSTYFIEAALFADGSSSGTFQFGWNYTGTTGTPVTINSYAQSTSYFTIGDVTVTAATGAVNTFNLAADANNIIKMVATVTTTTSGTFSLQWASGNGSSLTLMAGSSMKSYLNSGAISGTSGASGASAYSGASGASGFSGAFSGQSGTSGTSGASGFSSAVVGPIGLSGTSGLSGISGKSGTSGSSGVSGPSGLSGGSGLSGFSGSAGPQGSSGFSSLSGTSGASGLSGLSGFSGPAGSGGTSGASGASGFSGTLGSTGPSGFSGQSGTSGFSGAFSGASGKSGYSGAIGTVGNSGYSGVSGFSGSVTSLYDYENVILGGFGGLELVNGLQAELRLGYNATIVECSIIKAQVGSIAIDIWKSDFSHYPPSNSLASIVGLTSVPTITNGQKYSDSSLVGWNTTINAGDCLQFYITSASAVTRATISLKLLRT